MMALLGKRERPMKRLFKAAGERGHSRSSSSNIPQDKRQQAAKFPGTRARHMSLGLTPHLGVTPSTGASTPGKRSDIGLAGLGQHKAAPRAGGHHALTREIRDRSREAIAYKG